MKMTPDEQRVNGTELDRRPALPVIGSILWLAAEIPKVPRSISSLFSFRLLCAIPASEPDTSLRGNVHGEARTA